MMRKFAALCLLCLGVFLCLSMSQSPAFAAVKAKAKTKGKESVQPVLYLPVSGEFSSPFGLRRIPRGRGSRMHKGIDISAEVGTPVCAAAPGKVIFVGAKPGYGTVVEIEHGTGLLTRYAHLDTHTIVAGSLVETGDSIGTVGETGHTTGSNLHFETVDRGRYVNPLALLGVNWQPPRFRGRSPLVLRPRPGVFAKFTPVSEYKTLLAPTTLPTPAEPLAR